MISRSEMLEAVRISDELGRRREGRKLDSYYPDKGPLRRALYPKHLEFFRLGATKRERLFLAANRVGKTEGAGGIELTYHLTGQYPAWWKGRRFTKPISAWAAGDTRQTVRDILQLKLLGKPGAYGTGLIPRTSLERQANAPGIPDAVETIWVRHVSGGISTLGLKSYDQGREAFQGTERDVIWLDEEPPADVYTECLLRTMTNGGMVMLTFTPLRGMSEVVKSFLDAVEAEKGAGSKAVVTATWDDVPHLTEQAKKELWAAIPPFQRDARSKGLPQLGAGAIYPVPESSIVIDPVPIQPFWRIAYGMDVGWNCTAAVFGAIDPDTDVLYLFREYAQGEQLPSVHAAAIKGKEGSPRHPGVLDPAARGRSQKDGVQLMQDYVDLGLDLTAASNVVEAGLFEVLTRMTTNRLKVFNTLVGWLKEFREYQRDEKGRVIKKNDHRMDCTRYLVNSGLSVARAPAPREVKAAPEYITSFGGDGTWMG